MGTDATNGRVISADSHFVEPPEMWAARIDHAYKERAPRLVHEVDGRSGHFIVCEGLVPNNGGGFLAAGAAPEDVPRVMELGYGYAPEHMRDPVARIAAQEEDGISAEVLYASYGMSLFHLEDGGLRDACFRAFNDWAADYCSASPTRLYGIGLVALDDIGGAVKELERIAAKGLEGAMIWAEPPDDHPYSHADYDPFWAAAEEHDMKLSLHSLTSKRTNFNADQHGIVYRSVILYQEVVRSITDLILHGTLERFPGLRIVSAENEIAWLPFHLWRMDQLYEKLEGISPVKLDMAPSDYFYRQVYATFIEDPLFATTMPSIGSGNIMWSSDFPHLASSFPNSHSEIDKLLAGVSQEDRRKIVHDNVAALYGIRLNEID